MILWPSYLHSAIFLYWHNGIYVLNQPMFLCVRCSQCHAARPHHDVCWSRLCSGGMRSRTCCPASSQGSQGVSCTMWYAAWCANVDGKQRHGRGSSVGKVSNCDRIIITTINSLSPGRCGNIFKSVISEHMLWIKFMSTSCEIALRWMPLKTFRWVSARKT